jgi:N-acetylglucosaminylphosphatidylinositol deacetylase
MSLTHAKSVALLVTAHPDDEIMFFAPILSELAAGKNRGCSVHVLCLSTGNSDGLGERRQEELRHCCALYKILPSEITIIDHPDLQDGMRTRWPVDLVADIFCGHARSLQPDLVGVTASLAPC